MIPSRPPMTDPEILERLATINTGENRDENEHWLASRPYQIRRMVESYPFDRAYRVREQYCDRLPIGTVVVIHSFAMDGWITVGVARDNAPAKEGQRHKIDPETLELYPLPYGNYPM